MSRLDLSASLLQSTHTGYTRRYGPTHTNTITAYSALADLKKLQGDHHQALTMFLTCVDVRKRLQGEKHPETLQAVSDLAACYAGNLTTSDPSDLLPLSLSSSLHSSLSSSLHSSLSSFLPFLPPFLPLLCTNLPLTLSLIFCLKVMERYAEAGHMYLDCVYEQEEQLGISHPETLRSMHGLAIVYFQLGTSIS